MKKRYTILGLCTTLLISSFLTVQTVNKVRFNRFYDSLCRYTEAIANKNNRLSSSNLSELEDKLLEQKKPFANRFPCTPDDDCVSDRKKFHEIERTVWNFEDYGKVYGAYDDGSFLLGNIERSLTERFDDKGFEPFEYKINLYRPQGGLDAGSRLCHWAYGRAYLNLSNAEIHADQIFMFGMRKQKEKKSELSFMDKLMVEVYTNIDTKARKEHPFLYKISQKDAFRRSFVGMVIDHLKHHEPVHKYSPSEIPPSINEIANNPETNGFTLMLLSFNDMLPPYKEVLDYFKERGYPIEKMADMKPESRSELAKTFLGLK